MNNPLFYARPDFNDVVIFVLIIILGIVVRQMAYKFDQIDKEIKSLRDKKNID